MKQQYKAFTFDGQTFHEAAAGNDSSFKFVNAVLNNDFYAEMIRGPRTIIEDKIPGRDIPYFYESDDSPLEFEVTFAFVEDMTKTKIKNVARKLLSVNTYKQLSFGEMVSGNYQQRTPIYNVIFHGDAMIHYIGSGYDDQGKELYLGYFTLKARVDRPYGYVVISGTVTAPPTVTNVVVNNTGDLSFYPNMTLTDPGEGTKPVRIFNEQNQSSVTFSQIYNLEVITINAKLKTITSSISNPSESIYVRWQKDELILNPGSNTLRFQTFNNGSWQNTNVAAFSLNGEAPVYIYDTN